MYLSHDVSWFYPYFYKWQNFLLHDPPVHCASVPHGLPFTNFFATIWRAEDTINLQKFSATNFQSNYKQKRIIPPMLLWFSPGPLAGRCQGSEKFLVGFLNLILTSDGFLTPEKKMQISSSNQCRYCLLRNIFFLLKYTNLVRAIGLLFPLMLKMLRYSKLKALKCPITYSNASQLKVTYIISTTIRDPERIIRSATVSLFFPWAAESCLVNY